MHQANQLTFKVMTREKDKGVCPVDEMIGLIEGGSRGVVLHRFTNAIQSSRRPAEVLG